jgi:hypothetical protein
MQSSRSSSATWPLWLGSWRAKSPGVIGLNGFDGSFEEALW